MKKILASVFFLLLVSLNPAIGMDIQAIPSYKIIEISNNTKVKGLASLITDVITNKQDSYFVLGDEFKDNIELKKTIIWLNSTLSVNPFYGETFIKEINLSQYADLKGSYTIANSVHSSIEPLLQNGDFKIIKTGNNSIFGYIFYNNEKAVLSVLNLDFENSHTVKIKIPKFNIKKDKILPIKIYSMPYVNSRKLNILIQAGGIVVIIIKKQN